MLRIQLSKPKTHKPSSLRSEADRYAIRYGLITAVLIVVYSLLVVAAGDGVFELAHLLIFLILFGMIGYGMHNARKWIRDDHASDDRMLFGLVMSAATAIGVFILNGVLGLIDYHLITSETILPIDDGFKFFVNAMGLFWSCLIFGFLSSFIFMSWYSKD